MRTSVYQCACVCDSTAIAENKIGVWVTDYASTRDFYGFEKLRSEEFKSLNLIIDIDLALEMGAVRDYDDKTTDSDEAIIWYAKNRIYAGLYYLKKYPLILEIVPDSIWLKIFYNHSISSLTEFAKSFKDKYDVEVQLSIANSLNRLNVNIALGDTYNPDKLPCIY